MTRRWARCQVSANCLSRDGNRKADSSILLELEQPANQLDEMVLKHSENIDR